MARGGPDQVEGSAAPVGAAGAPVRAARRRLPAGDRREAAGGRDLPNVGPPPSELTPEQLASWAELGALLPVARRDRSRFITAVQLHAATRHVIEELSLRATRRPNR